MLPSAQIWTLVALSLALVSAPTEALRAAEAAHNPATAGSTDLGPTDVALPAIFVPMVLDNRLTAYAYMLITLTPVSREGTLAIREKVPFLIDAFLREVHRASIVKPGAPKEVDTEALKPRLMERVEQVLGKGTVVDLKFQQIALTPIQPV